jgi:hypothetical protein
MPISKSNRFRQEINAALCFLYTQFQYLKTTPKSYLFQNTNWYANERFWLVFTPKTWSINLATVLTLSCEEASRGPRRFCVEQTVRKTQ